MTVGVAWMRRFYFDVFTLDPSRFALFRGDHELPLRPKAFDVLRYLVEHAGEVVSKEALFEAVWDGVARTDGSLVQCIKDIREVLGDADHQVIKAVPKRGYLFTSEVSTEGADRSSAASQSESRAARPLYNAVQYALAAQWRAAALVAAGMLIAAAGLAAWTLRDRPLSPNVNAAYYAMLGHALLDKRTPKTNTSNDVLVLFDKALSLDPNSVPALLGYARAMLIEVMEGWAQRDLRLARLDQAEIAIERAVKLEPRNAAAHRLRASLLRARGDPVGAITTFEHALALNPNSAWGHAELGRSKIDVGRSEDALVDIEHAIRLSPADPLRHIWYAWAGLAAIHIGDKEVALRWLVKAHEAEPANVVASLLLAIAYAEIGREDEARALMAERLARPPTLTLWSWNQDHSSRNPLVAKQRERITAVLRRLGVPEGKIKTGSVQRPDRTPCAAPFRVT